METTINKLKESHVLKSGSVQTLLTKLLQLVPGKTSENLSILSVDVQPMPCGISASFFLEQVLLMSRKVYTTKLGLMYLWFHRDMPIHLFSSLNTSRLHKVAMEITARS